MQCYSPPPPEVLEIRTVLSNVLRRWVFNKLAVFLFCTYSYSVHAYIHT